MAIVDTVNKIAVRPELLGQALTIIDALPRADQRSYERRSIAVAKQLKRDDTDDPHVLMAVMFRLGAIADVARSADFKAWRKPAKERGASFIHPDIVRCAAEEPLLETSGGMGLGFDLQSFRDRLLRICDPQGHS